MLNICANLNLLFMCRVTTFLYVFIKWTVYFRLQKPFQKLIEKLSALFTSRYIPFPIPMQCYYNST